MSGSEGGEIPDRGAEGNFPTEREKGKKRNGAWEREKDKKRKWKKVEKEWDMKVEDKRESIGIGTWNVRTLNIDGKVDEVKLEEVKREMKRYKLGVLGMSEVRWKGQGDEVDDDGVRIIFSGGDKHKRGVAIVLEKEVTKKNN